MPPLEVPLVQSDDDDAEVEDATNESLAYCGTTRRGIVSYLAAVLLLVLAVCHGGARVCKCRHSQRLLLAQALL